MKFIYNNSDNLKLSTETRANFNKIFTLVRPDIINKGDRLEVNHRGESYLIPLTRFQKITVGHTR